MAQRRLLSIRYLFGVRYQSSSAAEPITVKGDNIPEPVDSFDATGFPEKIVNKLKSKYEKPSTIQGISWPIVLAGRDLISVAKTGSGKTLGFILPGIVHSLKSPRRPPGGGPTALVLAPTRELAQQVNLVAAEYAPMMNRNSACIFGGGSRTAQELILKGGVDICIATPGRILDFLAAGSTDLNKCSYLVLDEADRMLDMGFEPQIREVVDYIKPERQTLMFSATWPDEVKALAEDFQRDPVFLNVGSLELSANHNIEQVVELVYEQDKQERLAQLLGTLLKEKDAKILIFVETKSKADGLARAILRVGWKAVCIHGGKTQLQRDTALNEFRIGRYPIMLATDVAARGLDVQDIKAVINYDFPNNIENYVHRIGRTGRQDKKGTAYSFFTSANAHQAKDLVRILEEAGQEVPPGLLQLSERQNFPQFRGFTDQTRGSDKYQKENRGYSKKSQIPRDQRKAFDAYHNKFRHHGY